MVRARVVAFRGWQHCQLLTNGTVEVIVTTDVGPRVVRYGLAGGPNVLCEVHEEDGLTGGDTWHTFGGHRLWHAPEASPRSYQPDGRPVAYEVRGDAILLRQDVEAATGIQKELEVTLADAGTEVTVLHRLTNCGLWPVRLAAWGITVMAPGGFAVFPQTMRDSGLLPNRCVALWPYARMDDPRVHWGRRFVALHQDPAVQAPFKLGVTNEAGWSAYINEGTAFVERFPWVAGAEYPDFGVNCESYMTDFMLEMETLSPLQTLQPGQSLEHTESWQLFTGVRLSAGSSEDEVASLLRESCALQTG
ncbi:MAG TPA: hypothetical protein PKH46_04150 [Candidatus Cryosericum sp.]|nr:hypothetical protein [Candidatus Cryosericum sp.]